VTLALRCMDPFADNDDVDQACRFCGCTDRRACVIDGVPCHWVAWQVCSNTDCVEKARPRIGDRADRALTPPRAEAAVTLPLDQLEALIHVAKGGLAIFDLPFNPPPRRVKRSAQAALRALLAAQESQRMAGA